MERTFIKLNKLRFKDHINNNGIRVGNEIHLKEGIRCNKSSFDLPKTKQTVVCSRLGYKPEVVTYHESGTLEEFIIRTKPW